MISSQGTAADDACNVIADLIDLPAKCPTLGDAYRIEARIIVWEGKDVLRVPSGALFRNGGGWAVFVAANGRAELLPVRIGKSNGLETEALEGVVENETVIAHPSDRIKHGIGIAPRSSRFSTSLQKKQQLR